MPRYQMFKTWKMKKKKIAFIIIEPRDNHCSHFDVLLSSIFFLKICLFRSVDF